MSHGEVNYVYKVVTEKGSFLAKVFRNRNWPEKGKLPWIEHQLQKYNIPHAKILFYSKSAKPFRFGFMISEFVEGKNGVMACKTGQLTLAQAYFKIGRTLKSVHKIKVSRFGSINNGKGESSNFFEWKLKKEILERLKKLKLTKKFPNNLDAEIVRQVTASLLPFNNRFRAVLNHGDPNRENALWSVKKQWVLIDWDNAQASTWLEDYADVSFWFDFKGRTTKATRLRNIFIKNFFLGYGKTEFKPDEVAQIAHGLYIIKCLILLDYYYFSKQNLKDFAMAKRKLYSLLK